MNYGYMINDEYIDIHKIFNSSHNLEQKETPLKEICEAHSEYTQYYCLESRKEICFKYVIIGRKHKEYKYIPFSIFKKYFQEIKDKLKFKTFKKCKINLEDIKSKKIRKKKSK